MPANMSWPAAWGGSQQGPSALFILRAANLQSTSDQSFLKQGNFTNYKITSVESNCVSGGATVTCAGGIYTGAAKSGNILVAAAQSWIGLSAVGKTTAITLGAPISTDIQTATPIFSLTTGSTAAATADIFIFGEVMD